MAQHFKLWLEFEEANFGDWDPKNDFCNIHVYLPDGRHYGINVWTTNFSSFLFSWMKDPGRTSPGFTLLLLIFLCASSPATALKKPLPTF